MSVGKPGAHDLHGTRIGVDQHVTASELGGHCAKGAAAGEEVKAPVAGARGGLDHAADDPLGLLGRVAGLLTPVGGHDRVPPDVGRELALRGLLGR